MDNYYKVADTTSTITDSFNYKAIKNSNTCDAISPSGAVKLLVLPIEFTDYTCSSQTLTDLNTALNGSGVTDTGYWESLASFYKKSSFGKFTPSYTVASKYVSGLTPAQFYAKETSSVPASSWILEQALANYKSVTGDSCTQFDHDGDGLIDAVILVYCCPDYSKDTAIKAIDTQGNVFWAYCYWDYDNYANASKTSPIGLNYFWMSYDFLYEEAASPKVDAHTLIHESGHLMGLDDCYSYDSKTLGSSKVYPAPMGGADMMDENVIDHDAFSKLALNWVKPYVVTGNSRITINPAESSGDCIVIPAKGSTWNGTAFDEYLLIELYTPTGLNALDAKIHYPHSVLGYGVRLWHVDARLAKYSYSSSGELQSIAYVEGSPATLDYDDLSYFSIAACNTASLREGEALDLGYNEVSLIQAGHPENT
jgi:M6 family metalloprotease-like protein